MASNMRQFSNMDVKPLPIVARRHNSAKSLEKQLGAATAVDFVLTLPLFFGSLLVIVQLALLAHASLVVRQAAFSAARSAQVHIVNSDHAFRELNCCFSQAWVSAEHARLIADAAGSDLGKWRDIATKSAMSTLVAIAPANEDYSKSASPGPLWNAQFMSQYYQTITTGHRSQYSTRDDVLLRKSRYAFDKINSDVEIQTISFNDLGSAISAPVTAFSEANRLSDYYSLAKYASRNELTFAHMPIRATVKFRFPLQIPFAAPFFSNDSGRPYVRVITMTVDLS